MIETSSAHTVMRSAANVAPSQFAQDNLAVVPNPVPEPSTVTLLLLGIMMLLRLATVPPARKLSNILHRHLNALRGDFARPATLH